MSKEIKDVSTQLTDTAEKNFANYIKDSYWLVGLNMPGASDGEQINVKFPEKLLVPLYCPNFKKNEDGSITIPAEYLLDYIEKGVLYRAIEFNSNQFEYVIKNAYRKALDGYIEQYHSSFINTISRLDYFVKHPEQKNDY